jgi:hypothetical protein
LKRIVVLCTLIKKECGELAQNGDVIGCAAQSHPQFPLLNGLLVFSIPLFFDWQKAERFTLRDSIL